MMRKSGSFILAVLALYLCNGFISSACGHSLVFGPEFFSVQGGKSQKIIKTFSVQDVSREFILSVQSGSGSGEGAARGAIKINGKLIFPRGQVGKQPRMLTKSVRLQKQNRISVEATGEPVILTIMSLEKQRVAAKIPPIGEAVDIEGYTRVIFPAGTFDDVQNVKISVNASPAIQDIFEINATGPRLPYEIRINTGNRPPKKDIEVSLKYPESFYATLYQIHIFARMHDNPDAPDVHDRFFMISSGLDDVIEMAMATLPVHAFSNRYGKNGTYEAVITVGLIH